MHTPRQRPAVSHGGVNRSPSESAPPRRTRRIVLVSLAILGLAGAAFAVRRPLLMAAPRCMAGRWHGCFDTFNGVLLMMLAGLPLAALVAWALARRRRVPGRVSLVPLRDLVTMGPVGIGGDLLIFAALGFSAALRGGGVRAAGPGARGRLLGPGRSRTVRLSGWTGCRRWMTPFRRGTERVRTDGHAGVGLGLAIVHSIVRAHDGTLRLVPRTAGGLLVTVRLPGTA